MIRKFLWYILIFVSVLILQMTIAPYIAILGIKPNFFLALVVLVALLKGPSYGVIFGAILGLIWDNFSPTGFGTFMILFVLLGLIVGIFKKYAFRDNYVISSIIVAISTIAYESIAYLVTVLSDFWSDGFLTVMGYWGHEIATVFTFEALYNVVAIILLQLVFGKIIMRFGQTPEEFEGELTFQK